MFSLDTDRLLGKTSLNSIYTKIYYLLAPAKRKAMLMVLAFIVVGTMFEVLGIGLLLPVIAVLVKNDLAITYPSLGPVLNAIGNPDHKTQVQIVMFLLIAVYFAKNFYLAFLAWIEARFSVGIQVELSQRLFTLYMRQPYNFHLQRNSAQLIRNITGEVGQFIGNAINPALLLFAEALVLISVLVLLLVVEPTGSIIVFSVLLLAAWLFHLCTHTRITRWGEIRQYHDGQRIQHLQQGLGGVKDVKLLGREANFLSQFHEHNRMSGKMGQFLQVLQKLPRLWLELLAVLGFVLLVLILLEQGKPMSSIVPTMGLFAAAAFRLMPSVNRILNSIQSLRYGLPAIDNLYNEFRHLEYESVSSKKESTTSYVLKNEIVLDSIKYNYPNTQVSALENISIDIKKGELIGLIGASGSGKSTLVDLILGLLAPVSGKVKIDGHDINQYIREWQDQIGYVSQVIYLTDDSLRRNIAFGLSEEQIDDEAINRAIKAAQLDELVMSLSEGLETMVGERGIRLSGGQRQRIGIARALYHDPEVLVLDEATSALDTETEKSVMQAILQLRGSKTVIIVAHRLSTVENCDRLYHLDKGKIIEEGKPDVVIKNLNLSFSTDTA
jgi:ATP-binding cassette, subfamily B, bacterial PglK